jgi:hypothetical protein
MKSVLKVGVLALALGFFATSCNSGGSNGANADSSATELNAPADQQAAPEAAPAAPDTTAAPAAADTTSNAQ